MTGTDSAGIAAKREFCTGCKRHVVVRLEAGARTPRFDIVSAHVESKHCEGSITADSHTQSISAVCRGEGRLYLLLVS